MSDQLIVIQTSRDGECIDVSCFSTIEETQANIEVRLESGIDPGDIKVYRGTEVEMKVAHRPVVSLATIDGAILDDPQKVGGPSTTEEGVPQFLSKYYATPPA